MKKQLKSASKEQLEALLLALYKQQPKERREVFSISVDNFLQGKELPDKQALIPNWSQLGSKIEQLEKDAWMMRHSCGRTSPSMRRRITKNLQEVQDMLERIPKESAAYGRAMDEMASFFWLCQRLDREDSFSDLKVWRRLKTSEEDYFRFALHRLKEQGLSRDTLKEMIRLTILSDQRHSNTGFLFEEIFLSMLKVGDTRMEVLEMLEGWLRDIDHFPFGSCGDLYEYAWIHLVGLYVMLAREEYDHETMMGFLEFETDPDLWQVIEPAYDKVTAYLQGDPDPIPEYSGWLFGCPQPF